jgi:hypothetical protein
MVESKQRSRITLWLTTAHPFWFTLYTAVTAFCLYTCLYAFRKTFAAATFSDVQWFGTSYKVWLVLFQMAGYGASKFTGIRIISELLPRQRSSGILIMACIAALSWLAFAVVPAPINIVFLFTNGFPLGLVWGMMFGYLEGRRVTEVLGAALSVSFIFSAGLGRSVGTYIIQVWKISEYWMPFVSCCLFLAPLLIFLFLLDKVPPPNAADEALRTKRAPMNPNERRRFTKTFLPGIILFVLTYMLLTTFRDFRDNFSAEVWKEIGTSQSPWVFTQIETIVSVIILIAISVMITIRKNIVALSLNHIIISLGFILVGISTWVFRSEHIDPSQWLILIGIGLYMGYVPFNSIFFDRLIASFRYVGTVGFLIYVADAFGYLGSIGVLILREFALPEVSWVNLFVVSGYIISCAGTLLTLASMMYFIKKHRHQHTADNT